MSRGKKERDAIREEIRQLREEAEDSAFHHDYLWALNDVERILDWRDEPSDPPSSPPEPTP